MGNEGSFSLQTQTWSRDSHGLFDYEFKKWTLDDMKLDKSHNIIYRAGDDIKLVENYTKLEEAKKSHLIEYPESNLPDSVNFTVLGYLISNKSEFRISSINHYNSYFKHKEALKEKYETYNYKDYGDHNKLEAIGVDRY